MPNTSAYVLVTLAVLITVACVLLISAAWGPVPHCKIIEGREIDNHHCIPYCPPDPKECG